MLFGSRVEGFGNADELMTKIAEGIPGLYFIVSQNTHTIRGSIGTSTKQRFLDTPYGQETPSPWHFSSAEAKAIGPMQENSRTGQDGKRESASIAS